MHNCLQQLHFSQNIFISKPDSLLATAVTPTSHMNKTTRQKLEVSENDRRVSVKSCAGGGGAETGEGEEEEDEEDGGGAREKKRSFRGRGYL